MPVSSVAGVGFSSVDASSAVGRSGANCGEFDVER